MREKLQLTYTEIRKPGSLPITENEAREVYEILAGNLDRHYLAFMWERQIAHRWSQGEDIRDLARLVVGSAFRWHEKYMYLAALADTTMEEICLRLYAAVGIEPPREHQNS